MTTVLEAQNTSVIQFEVQELLLALLVLIITEIQYVTESMYDLHPFLHTLLKKVNFAMGDS
jgi:hypothetical protein